MLFSAILIFLNEFLFTSEDERVVIKESSGDELSSSSYFYYCLVNFMRKFHWVTLD